LNQKYFNGIGNYLRAEILYRLKIPPFEKARTVLEALKHPQQDPSLTLSKKLKLKRENPDLLELCHTVSMEVVELGGKGYDPEHSEDTTAFRNWLQCYSVPGMNCLRDSKGRTIWFQGEPGPMAPKGGKTRKKRAQPKAEPDIVTPEVTTRASRRLPRGRGSPLKPSKEEEKVVADDPGQGRGRRRRKAAAAAAPAPAEPEAPVRAKRGRAAARRGTGEDPAPVDFRPP
ncbi:PREDICTED: endonuclease 8-like 1, partial [Tinamus guttatus]|uniref:endonuclease 8-like 1 n=1 Tax=Tinamus guttatus TaxID=94827 RepID=UPI00052F3888